MEMPVLNKERPALNKAQTAKKALIPTTLGGILASVTYRFVAEYIDPVVWASFCAAVIITIKDELKYKFKII